MKTLSLVVSALMSLLGVMAHASQPGSASAPESIVQSKSFDLGCPTLSWEPVDGARSYELVVYSLGDPNSVSLGDSEPLLRETVAGGLTSWTLEPARSLSSGTYAWSVRAHFDDGVTSWSELARFRVTRGSRALERDDALPDHAPEDAPLATAVPVFEDEVIVTAQRRSESTRDVPISITALTRDQIEDAGVTSNLELPTVVPGLEMDRIGASTIPAIRGASSYLTTVGTDANVAMYIDNIYVSSMQAATLDLSDVSRIEVLKGPQGTLFGRNATGGAIRIFTRDPQLTQFGGDCSAGFGSYDNVVVKCFVTTPIIPGKLAASVSGYRETGDTCYHNLTPDVPLQEIDSFSVRAKVLFVPSDRTRVLLTANTGQRWDPSAILYYPLDGITIARDVPDAVIPTRPYDVATDVPIFEKVSGDGVNIQLHQTTSLGEFSVLGAWSQAEAVGPVPLVAAAYPEPFTGFQSNVNDHSEAWSMEVDLASRSFGRFSFIAGANYYDKTDRWDPLEVEQSIPGNVFAVSIFAAQSTEAYAVFGEATYQVSERLSIVGGLRYSNEKRGATGSVVPGLQLGGEYYDWGSRTFDSVTERVSLRFALAPRSNVYVTYSTGFKSGNYIATSIPFGVSPDQCRAANDVEPGSCVFPPVLLPEEISAFEIGVKSTLASWLDLEAAAFTYKLSDIQIQSYENICLQEPCPPNPLVQLSEYSNAASGRTYGAEVSLDAQVTDELHIRAGVALLDATFTSYENASWAVPDPDGPGMVQVPTTPADGKRLPRAPRATLSLMGTYARYTSLGLFTFTATGRASDRVYYDVGNVFFQPRYETLAVRATYSPASFPDLTFTAWGDNVTDTRVILGTILGSSGANVSFASPATYGVKVSYKF